MSTQEIVAADLPGLERLQRKPIYDSIDERQLALITSQVAPNCTPGEVGHFLELTAHYGLDPFAREAWCAKSKTGQLLIMVGRDGLRKIAQRNSLHVDGDVVYTEDEFRVTRTPDGDRTVHHAYGQPGQRGHVIGAWAECREGGPMGRPMGFFFAPLVEYRPQSPSPHSPWSKQTGVMILAAAERQAIRQATPLGGLLAQGEDESATASRTASGVPAVLPEGLGDLVARAHAIDPSSWRMNEVTARLPLPHEAGYQQAGETLIAEVTAWLAEHDPADAEVVTPTPEPELEPTGQDIAPALQQRWKEDQQWRDSVHGLLMRSARLEAALDGLVADGDERADEVRDELDNVESDLLELGVPAGWQPEHVSDS